MAAVHVSRMARTLAEWGLWDCKQALRHPGHAPAHHHNAHMMALNVMALEACA